MFSEYRAPIHGVVWGLGFRASRIWVAVKDLNLTYYNAGTISSTTYIYIYGSFPK